MINLCYTNEEMCNDLQIYGYRFRSKANTENLKVVELLNVIKSSNLFKSNYWNKILTSVKVDRIFGPLFLDEILSFSAFVNKSFLNSCIILVF